MEYWVIIIEIDDWYFYTAKKKDSNFEIMIPSRITIFSSPNPRINRVLNLFLKIWTKKKSSSLENKQKNYIHPKSKPLFISRSTAFPPKSQSTRKKETKVVTNYNTCHNLETIDNRMDRSSCTTRSWRALSRAANNLERNKINSMFPLDRIGHYAASQLHENNGR